MNSFLGMMAAEDRCLPALASCSLAKPAVVSTVTPCAELTTTQSDSSSLFHHALLSMECSLRREAGKAECPRPACLLSVRK